MSKEVFDRCQAVLGYQFKDSELLTAALTHASVADHRLMSNERLEFLGDAVLGAIVCEELYHRFPQALEGELTKIKSMVVSRRTCAIISKKLGLQELLFLGKGMAGRRRLPPSLAAAVLESVIGAIYLDGGFAVVKQFILKNVRSQIDEAVSDQHQRNYKSTLQQYSQRVFDATPQYEVLDEKGPDHAKCFEICVVISGRRFASAWGPSKKEAEQKAAYAALEELEILDVPPSDHERLDNSGTKEYSVDAMTPEE